MTATLLKGGLSVEDPRLDRVPSPTDAHIRKYPLTAELAAASDNSMVIGVNWYSNFDDPAPTIIGRHKWFVIGQGDLGSMRGGHSVCLPNYRAHDSVGWWQYYDQGNEGRCVEFASCRERTLANRRRYDITSRYAYWWMQANDPWDGGSYPGAAPQYEGTSVDAAMQYMAKIGPVRSAPKGATIPYERATPTQADGIGTYRWATNWNDVRLALSVPDDVPGVPLLNSWGKDYPHEVLLLDAAGERLLREDGEFAIVTDK